MFPAPKQDFKCRMIKNRRTVVTLSNDLHGRTAVIFSNNSRNRLPIISPARRPMSPLQKWKYILCSNCICELPNARSRNNRNLSAQKLQGARTAGAFQHRRSFSNNQRRAQDHHILAHFNTTMKILIQLIRRDNTTLTQADYNELIIAMRQLVYERIQQETVHLPCNIWSFLDKYSLAWKITTWKKYHIMNL